MTGDLKARLRQPWFTNGCEALQLEAADHIETLEAALARLKAVFIEAADGQFAYWDRRQNAVPCLEDCTDEDGENNMTIDQAIAFYVPHGRFEEAHWWRHKIDEIFAATNPGDEAKLAARDFQDRVKPWMDACFGPAISADTFERNHRFLEEAIELVQACGCTRGEAHQLVDYVFDREIGERAQEVGGVMVTLAALCLAQNLDMQSAGETELARIWTKVEQIRAKQAAKPKHSPLPQARQP